MHARQQPKFRLSVNCCCHCCCKTEIPLEITAVGTMLEGQSHLAMAHNTAGHLCWSKLAQQTMLGTTCTLAKPKVAGCQGCVGTKLNVSLPNQAL